MKNELNSSLIPHPSKKGVPIQLCLEIVKLKLLLLNVVYKYRRQSNRSITKNPKSEIHNPKSPSMSRQRTMQSITARHDRCLVITVI